MARNVEIKARVSDLDDMLPRALKIATEPPRTLLQDDTFFNCENGRLKLRTFENGQAELIFYRRADQAGPTESWYRIARTSGPDALREVLTASNGLLGRVIKHRTLVLVGRSRIHLDRVQDLGDFLEIEVMLRAQEDTSEAIAQAKSLMQYFGIEPHQLIEGAYLDLLQAQPHPPAGDHT